MILDKTLRRIRQIVAIISESRIAQKKEERLIVSWQTRSLAMVMAASSASPSDELNKFAANLTIDNDELEQFKNEGIQTPKKSKVPINANTQEDQAKKNFDAAADKNSFEMLMLFGKGVQEGKPGH